MTARSRGWILRKRSAMSNDPTRDRVQRLLERAYADDPEFRDAFLQVERAQDVVEALPSDRGPARENPQAEGPVETQWGGQMDRAEKYRANAAQAFKDAENATRVEDKALFLEIAQRWLELAQLRSEPSAPLTEPPSPDEASEL
jgi:hypothetical protein